LRSPILNGVELGDVRVGVSGTVSGQETEKKGVKNFLKEKVRGF